MRTFSELEMDALTEAFNLSLGEAANTFSAIVREEIELSVDETPQHGGDLDVTACEFESHISAFSSQLSTFGFQQGRSDIEAES